MALAANVDHGGHSGRRGAMITVTIVAGRRRKIAFARDHFPMHALLILLDLIGRNFVRRHVVFVGVAGTAGLGDTQRVHRGTRVIGRSD